ncbi:MAG: hypothetical protein SPE18_06545 [Candidatus Limivicinus sp.]|nr:hypothetical protein [Candidatus Limivicinus sp.]
MKKTLKTISALALVLVLLLGMSATAFAESKVTYEGGAEKFVFLPGSEYSETDLFENFKGVMPGDVITQEITVQNNYTKAEKVNIYLRAVVHDEQGNPLSEEVARTEDLVSMQDFLSQLTMTVKQGDKVLFSASPDELDGLKENVLLGAFPGKSYTKLVVELSVPIELGNEYANRVGEVDWVFTAEEVTKTVQTGDDSDLILWAALMTLSLVTAAGVILSLNRKNKEHS